jgi:hypothetical protein
MLHEPSLIVIMQHSRIAAAIRKALAMPQKTIPVEVLIEVKRRLATFPPRSHERRLVIAETARLFGVSEQTLYRALAQRSSPKALRRADRGIPRVLAQDQMERYCELIAALKVRTSNKKGRHLSTAESIRLIETFGIETPDGLVQAPAGTLSKTTVNRYLRQWGYDRATLSRQPAAVHFQAEHSNDCWQFDLSPSDLKHIKKPSWVREDRKPPTLMLFSVVDDRSGVAYQEYRCVYGEEVEAALRFLFNAMRPKEDEAFPVQGIPLMIYMDNGPLARSQVFLQVMRYLGIEVITHMPAGSDGRRVTARAKGKVERPFRTVKEMHETLYHFHEPQDEAEANAWLLNYLIRYNAGEHRYEPHSRLEDWLQNIPPGGIRALCTWERFCTFAREPERRKVGSDARVSVGGTHYQVDPDLAGEEVILWWGLFDQELYVEHGEKRFGPYAPAGGPIPLHHYRAFKKTRTQARADRIEALADRIGLPRAALENRPALAAFRPLEPIPVKAFVDPDPFQELTFPNAIAAKLAISKFLGLPLAKLPPEQLERIHAIVAETLNQQEVMARVRAALNPQQEESHRVE